MKKLLQHLITHSIALGIGFAAGIYLLPILTAPPAPNETVISAIAQKASFTARFKRDLDGSDALHWGEGELFIARDGIALRGKLAPGPDYRLYLSPAFVENEAQVLALKDQMLEVGAIRTFDNFMVDFPQPVAIEQYNTVLVWCEAFGEFISAAQYR